MIPTCKRGHQLTVDNVYPGGKVCRKCKVASLTRQRDKRKPGRRRKPFTACPHGHSYAEHSYFNKKGVRSCRRCNAGHRPLNARQARKVIEAINEGFSITQLSGRKANGHTVGCLAHSTQVKLLCQANLRLGRILRRKLEANRLAHHVKAIQTRRASAARANHLVHRNVEVATATIARVVPDYLPYAQRQDVIADMMLAYCEGRLEIPDIERRLREYVTAQYRQFSNYGPQSLDAPAYREGALPLIETISEQEGLWR